MRQIEIPAGRSGVGRAAGAGFCARLRGTSELQIDIGVAFFRDENGWRTRLVRKQAVVPLVSDASRIEWVP